ncbi:unnamed protein product, partial [Schistosoma rodhaini]|uniref:Cadherin domain-containing protein n=1 Tax=Schistosoma rodhaini TaxID=6188 RepID=A0AA85EMP3_9TREM
MKLKIYIFFIFLIIHYIYAFINNKSINIQLKIKEQSSLYTTIGNITQYLYLKSKITSDSIYFNITHNGLIQLIKIIDIELLCIEQFLCCNYNQLCELASNIIIEELNSNEMKFIQISLYIEDINDHKPQFTTTATTTTTT